MDENNSSSSTQSNSGSSKKWIVIVAIVAVILIIIAGGGFFFLNNKEGSPAEEMTEGAEEGGQMQMVSPTPADSTESGSTNTGAYKDGVYEAEGKYQTHVNTEAIGVKVTLKDGVITDVEVTEEAVLPMSKQMQADFAANYKTEVVGKNIDEVNLGKVSGSSLTPIGFNAAIEDIKAQARS